MNKLHRIYMPFLNAGMKEAVSYRANFLIGMLGNILGCFISFFLWQAIFLSSNHSDFMGFTMSDMVVYVFLSFLTGYLTSSDVANVVGGEIKDGTIAMRMIRPANYTMTNLFEGIGSKIMGVGILFPPLIVGVELYRGLLYGSIQFRIGNFLLYLISGLMAYLINFYFSMCIGFTAFIFSNLWGVNMFVSTIVDFLSGALIPLAFFPNMIENVLLILPFASLSYTPVMIYMDAYKGLTLWTTFGLQLFWLFFFYVLSKIVFRVSVRKLNVQGG